MVVKKRREGGIKGRLKLISRKVNDKACNSYTAHCVTLLK